MNGCVFGGTADLSGASSGFRVALQHHFSIWKFWCTFGKNVMVAAVTASLMPHLLLSPCVQAMTSRVTGSSRGSAELGQAFPACCPAGTQITSFPSRITSHQRPSCNLHGLLGEVTLDPFVF